MLKKIKIKLIFINLIAIFLIPTLAWAGESDIKDLLNQAAGPQGAGFDISPELAQTGLGTVVGTVAQMFISIFGIIFICYIIYGGYLWMTAGGNEEKITRAKKLIRDGIIGLIIIFSAAGIYLFIKTALIGSSAPVGPAPPI